MKQPLRSLVKGRFAPEVDAPAPDGQLRVLFVVTSAATVKAFLAPMVSALRREGMDVTVVCGPGAPETVAGAPVVELRLDRSGSPVAAVAALTDLYTLIGRFRPHLLICATPVASLLGVVVGRLQGVGSVVHLAWGLRSESMRGVARAAMSLFETMTVRLAHLTLANSSSLRDVIIADRCGAPSRVRCLGPGSSHGVNLERFRRTDPPNNEPIVVGFVGRVRRDKGVAELLEATRRMVERGVKVALELTGPLEDSSLVDAVAQHPTAKLNAPTDTPERVMAGIDILCLPSWREGFPNVVLEASATGRPVVVSDATGVRDSVVDGLTGLRFRCGDVEDLERALTRLVESPEDRRSFGLNGRSWVEENFEESVVCTRLAGHLSSLVRGRHVAGA